MGNAESVPRERQQQKSSRLDLEALQEKYDGFHITEDRETDSMIVERNVRYENRGRIISNLPATSSYYHSPRQAILHVIKTNC
jgi:bleomycin hydrolase